MEAAMVLAVVFFAISSVIISAYRRHDRVTGNMILQEMVEKTRYSRDQEKESGEFEAEGEKKGNPRLWLGTYQLNLEWRDQKVQGSAQAGDWKQELEMREFLPEKFLRRCQAILEMGNEWNEAGD